MTSPPTRRTPYYRSQSSPGKRVATTVAADPSPLIEPRELDQSDIVFQTSCHPAHCSHDASETISGKGCSGLGQANDESEEPVTAPPLDILHPGPPDQTKGVVPLLVSMTTVQQSSDLLAYEDETYEPGHLPLTVEAGYARSSNSVGKMVSEGEGSGHHNAEPCTGSRNVPVWGVLADQTHRGDYFI